MKAGRSRCAASGKYQYPDLATAVHAALVSSKRRGTPLRPYECPCGSWHLTKRPGNPRVATVPTPFTPADLARIVNRTQESA